MTKARDVKVPAVQKPLTAAPVGRRYAVATRGRTRVETWPLRGGKAARPEEVSDNTVEMAEGCYRALPTSYE